MMPAEVHQPMTAMQHNEDVTFNETRAPPGICVTPPAEHKDAPEFPHPDFFPARRSSKVSSQILSLYS